MCKRFLRFLKKKTQLFFYVIYKCSEVHFQNEKMNFSFDFEKMFSVLNKTYDCRLCTV